jgi:aryl-alcohol dehydrogenase-like predicted oxidoreductase
LLEDEPIGRRSRLVLGSADLKDDAVTPGLLGRFYGAGGRALDVANVYADGESQRAIGKWLRASGVRDQLVLYGKGCHPPFCSPGLVHEEVERSLTNLGVDRLEVFLLHRDDPSVSVAIFADALQEEIAAGTILGFGVSNWTLARFRALSDHVRRAGDGLAAFSNHFSLAEMVTPTWPGCLAVTKGDLAELARAGVQMLAWASLAMGYFAGRDPQSWASPENEARRRRAAQLAAELGTTPNAVALAYVLSQPPNVHAVVGTRSEEHLAEALEACELELTPEQTAWLEAGGSA